MSVVFSDEQSVFFVGGRGDKSGRIANAGGCTKVWWDNESDKAAATAKLMTSTGAPIFSEAAVAYTSGNNRIRKAGIGTNVEVGMVVYVIEEPVPGTDVQTGRYKITDVDPGGGWIECSGIVSTGDASVDVEIGGAFDTLNNASDETSATIYSVWLHTNLAETLTAAVTITAGGDNGKNTFKRILGFNTVPGDMNRGGAYYESPYQILRNGPIDGSKTVTLDANNGAFVVIDIDADNLQIENLYLTNTNGQNAILFSNSPQHIVFRNCRFSDVSSFCNTGEADSVLIDSCYGHPDTTNHHYILRGNNNVVLNCVSNVPATRYFVVGVGDVELHVIGCLVVNGAQGVRLGITGATLVAMNNTFYGQTAYGVNLDSGFSGMVASVFNNIFALNPGAVALRAATTGSFIYNDYNCFIESDGQPLTVGAHGDGEVPVIGPHSIEVDPLFVDAANDDFSLANNSPCIDAGRPDSLGGFSTIGAYDYSANRGVSKSRVIGGV